MKILFDVGHPAHVHYCRILAKRLEELGWSCLFTTKDKEIVIYLLKHYGLDYESWGKHKKGVIGKVWSLFSYTLRLYLVARKYQPDFFFNASPSAAFVSWIMGKVHIGLEDTFNMEQVRLYLPFTDVVLTGDYPHPSLGKKEIRYPGYHELAYLHPNVFTPDESVLDSLGVKKGERYAIVRFVAWNASHDIGHKGITDENKSKLIQNLSSHLKVFISSETDLSPEHRQYQINIKPEDMHSALAFAQLFVGESATMASECAVLGTPAIYINNSQLGYIKDEARYGLAHMFTESEIDQVNAIDKAITISKDMNIKKTTCVSRDLMLLDKIDVSSLLIWFIINFPGSEQEMRRDNFDFSRFK